MKECWEKLSWFKKCDKNFLLSQKNSFTEDVKNKNLFYQKNFVQRQHSSTTSRFKGGGEVSAFCDKQCLWKLIPYKKCNRQEGRKCKKTAWRTFRTMPKWLKLKKNWVTEFSIQHHCQKNIWKIQHFSYYKLMSRRLN